MDNDQPSEWLPLAEAAERLATTVDALRKRVRREQVQARRGNDGRIEVLVSAQPPTSPGLDTGQPVAGLGPDNGQALARLELELEEALERQEAWRKEAEAARLEAAGLRAERDSGRELIRSLEEQVRWLRQPFWRRWLDRG